jgi:hypothetical protein
LWPLATFQPRAWSLAMRVLDRANERLVERRAQRMKEV